MRYIFIGILLFICTVGSSQIGMTLRRDRVTAGPSFAPTDISGLKIWYDGADIDGDGNQEGLSESGLSGTSVINWVDKGSQGVDLSISEGSPTAVQISGNLYAIKFDGNDCFISSGISKSLHTFLHTDDCTIIIRFEQDDLPNTRSEVIFSNLSGSTTNNGYYLNIAPFNSIESAIVFVAASTTQRVVYSGESIGEQFTASNTYYNMSILTNLTTTIDADECIAYINNTLVSNNPVNNSINDGTVNTGPPAFDLHIGCQVGNASNLFGSIEEIIVYNKRLNTAEMLDIENYLNNKWN